MAAVADVTAAGLGDYWNGVVVVAAAAVAADRTSAAADSGIGSVAADIEDADIAAAVAGRKAAVAVADKRALDSAEEIDCSKVQNQEFDSSSAHLECLDLNWDLLLVDQLDWKFS